LVELQQEALKQSPPTRCATKPIPGSVQRRLDAKKHRSAANTAFTEGIASLEYADSKLAVALIVVMGHQGCGAGTAARSDKPPTPALDQLVARMRA
jgi:carbonic anhydrase